MSKIRVLTKNTIKKFKRSDLQCGELFKVVKYGSDLIFMAVPDCYYKNNNEDVLANAVRMDIGTLWYINDDIEVVPVNCTLVEDYDDSIQ